ncbi:MAG TPA: hypothetical protein GX699_12170 [Firmicutes bacterium]|nr:hypothetical protein [Bacillota bacterium]
MKNKIIIVISLVILAVLSLTACTPSQNSDPTENLTAQIETLNARIKDLEEENQALKAQLSNQTEDSPNLLITALKTMELLKNKEMAKLADMVHPQKGLRFSPYFFVDVQNDKVFNAQQVAGLNEDTAVYTWGVYDGIGEPIELTFNDYYDKFVYDEDFLNPHLIGNNTPIGSGNTVDNVAEAYPDGTFIEFHFTGFAPGYDGMDWRSLRLVFEQNEGKWYLVGIIHGQWTI